MRTSERATYKNGEKTGLWEEFYENGVLKVRGNYKNNLPEGLWDYWDEDGKRLGGLDYIDGVSKHVK
jgi:antitoxin component YwqK of YwqJK toxin-antitoxin module